MDSKCPNCGKTLFGDDPVCWYCNEPVHGTGREGKSSEAPGFSPPPFGGDDDDVECPHCHRSTDKNKKECEWCHEPLSGQTTSTSPAEEPLVAPTSQLEPAFEEPPPKPAKSPPPKPPAPAKPPQQPTQRPSYRAPRPVSAPPVAQGNKNWIVSLIVILGILPVILIFVMRDKQKSQQQKREAHRRALRAKKRAQRYNTSSYKDRRRRQKKNAIPRKSAMGRLPAPAKAKRDSDFMLEKGCFIQKKASKCEEWAKRNEHLRYDDKPLFKKVIEARKRACTHYRKESCKALSRYAQTDVRSLSAAQKREFYTLACEKAKHTRSCDRAAFMEVYGIGGPLDTDTARRHTSGLCSNNSFYCWNEGEVKEVAAWHTLNAKGRPAPGSADLWYGKLYTKSTAVSFMEAVKAEKLAALSKMESGVPEGYYRPLKELEGIKYTPKNAKETRFAQVKIRLFNGGCTTSEVSLTMAMRFSSGKPDATVIKKKKTCYATSKKEKSCFTVTKRKGAHPEVTATLSLAPNQTRVALFEFDTTSLGKGTHLFNKFVVTGSSVKWRGKCPRPSKRDLYTLKGQYSDIRTLYERGCEKNRANNPGYMLCRYLAKLGRHTKGELAVLCNKRTRGESFVDGACHRLNDRFKVNHLPKLPATQTGTPPAKKTPKKPILKSQRLNDPFS